MCARRSSSDGLRREGLRLQLKGTRLQREGGGLRLRLLLLGGDRTACCPCTAVIAGSGHGVGECVCEKRGLR